MKQRSGMPYDVVYYSTNETMKQLSLEEEGAFHRLLRHAWIEGSLPNNVRKLALICHCPEEAMQRIWSQLESEWRLNRKTGRLTNAKQEAERRYVEGKQRMAKQASKVRWSRSPSKRTTKVHASALRTHSSPTQPNPPLPFPIANTVEGSLHTKTVHPPIPAIVSLGAHRMIVMTVEEERAARDQLGDAFEPLIVELDDYSQSRPDKFRLYKNHFAVLRQWHRRRQQQAPSRGVIYERESKVEGIERRNRETAGRDVRDVLERIGASVSARMDVRGDEDLPVGASPGSIGSA